MRCSCGIEAEPGRLSCQRHGTDDRDHVLALPTPAEWLVDGAAIPGPDENPLIRYRRMLASWQFARDAGLSDDAYVKIVTTLDDAIAEVDFGRRFRVSALHAQPHLISSGLVIKNETGNVSGSHKSRHVGGIMVHLLAQEALRSKAGESTERSQLAIASCGNAALAAAVVAAAAEWPISIFVPPTGDPLVLARLRELGADLHLCERRVDDPPGDPAYLRFREAVARGATAFGCQGPDNAMTIDAGRTLGFEIAEQAPETDRVVLQVGGAALTSAVAQGLSIAADLDRIESSPSIHTVQVAACAPLARAYEATIRLGGLSAAVEHRSEVMWPWENIGPSIAYGILDDETYDWAAAVRAMLETEGKPLVIDDDWVAKAHALAPSATGLHPCTTGVAGLAGGLALDARGDLTANEHVLVIFTGVDREHEATILTGATHE